MRDVLRAICAAAAVILPGCGINIVRVKSGNPLDVKGYDEVQVGTTTRNESVDRLGPPEKLEWKNGKDYLWWIYADVVETGIRFQVPPPPFNPSTEADRNECPLPSKRKPGSFAASPLKARGT